MIWIAGYRFSLAASASGGSNQGLTAPGRGSSEQPRTPTLSERFVLKLSRYSDEAVPGVLPPTRRERRLGRLRLDTARPQAGRRVRTLRRVQRW